MQNINKDYGVVYDQETKQIKAIKTPENRVFPSDKDSIYECDTLELLEQFILNKELKEQVNGEF